MRRERAKSSVGRVAVVVGLAALGLSLVPEEASAQYFGRNKVQYETFEWRNLQTDHFKIYFYPEEEEPVTDAARMGERWYSRLTRVFNHEFEDIKPIILYANHPDFQQTNTTQGQVSEGTGGFTESLKNRVVMPLTGVYQDNDHVLGHELVHAFQYDIAQRMGAMGQQGLGSLPLWLIEGMAEYLSVGREDPHTAMWLRDAALRGDLPTFQQLTSDPRFFPYRYGQALWAYIGGRWGDRAVTDLYKSSLRYGWDMSVRRVLRTTSEDLNTDWMRSIRAAYLPLMQGKERPEEIATKILDEDIDAGRMNVGPSLSPDGRYVAFYTERDLFEISLYMADARTGQMVEKIADSQTDIHFDALSFLSSAGAWSPDGTRMAFTAFAKGDEELAIVRLEDQEVERRVAIEGVGAVNSPAWSPDGRTIAMSGNRGGVSDLFLLDVESGAVTQLTNDKYADLQPAWSPDGRKVAFVTDRVGTDFEQLTFGSMKLALADVETGELEILPLFSGGKHIDPHFGPDGRWLYFISDADGFVDVYRTDVNTGAIERVTRVATGVSGITKLAPALTVAANTGDIMFSVFSEGNYAVYRMDADQVEARAEPIMDTFAGLQPAGVLPPLEAANRGIVANYLAEAQRGLIASNTEFPVDTYSAGLALDHVGVPRVGVAMDRFGTSVAGAVTTYWTDMLGNRQLVAAVQANGTLKDVGGLVQYVDRKGQMNWGVVAGHIPNAVGGLVYRDTVIDDQPLLVQDLQILRIYQDQLSILTEFPRSRTRRFEASAGMMRYGFGLEAQRILINAGGQQVDGRRVELDPAQIHPDFGEDYWIGTASAAYVGDWSYNGFTSPIRGGRFRFEVTPMFGDLNVVSLLGDYRRYFHAYPVTFAVRGLHSGRYGPDSEGTIFTRQDYLGYETLVRGYAYESFTQAECVDVNNDFDPDCTVFSRLRGSRLAVANMELRVPLFGVPEYGLLNFPFLPTELSAFVDAGLAWNSAGLCEETDQPIECSPTFQWDAPGRRTPVVSTGVSARVNVLGFMIFEAYYAYPFQRPDTGWHLGFNLAPGW